MRRHPRETVVSATELPAYLASGPCIEDWSEPGARFPQHSALRAWQHAVNAWARSVGYGGAARPLTNAQNLARCRTAWSRAWLITDGRGALADYFDGKRATAPTYSGWRPNVAPGADPV